MVVFVGETIILFVVCPVGDQLYEFAPFAVSVTELPAQIVGAEAVTVKDGIVIS